MVRNIVFLILVVFNMSLFANIAKVVALRGDVSVIRDGKNEKLQVNHEIKQSDEIVTLNNSKVQILFKDNTVITIGKNSNFSISKYIFDSKNEPEVKLNFSKGVFRVITGKIGKIAPERFKIRTKTSSIGIRGTQILVDIKPSVEKIYCTEGIIEVLSLNSNDMNIVNAGKLIRIDLLKNIIKQEKIPKESLEKLDESTTFSTDTTSIKADTNFADVSKSLSLEDNTSDEAVSQINEEINKKAESLISDSVDDFFNLNTKPNILMATVSNTSSSEFRSVNNSTFDLGDSTSENVKINISNTDAIYSLLFDEFELKNDDSNTSFNSATVSSLSKPTWTPTTSSAFYSQQHDDIDNSVSKFNSNDSVSWGKWNMNASSDDYDMENYENNYLSQSGYWLQGEVTNSKIIDSYKSLDITANYEGYILASDNSFTNYDVNNSSANFQVNFSNETLNGTMNFSNTNTYNVNGTISGNGFSINEISNNENATIDSNGKFFGTDGTSMGGDFHINDTTNSKEFSGVFISRSTDLEEIKENLNNLNDLINQ